KPITLNDRSASWAGKIAMGLEYALKRTGPLAIGAAVAGAFARTEPGLEDPDIQIHYVPFSTNRLGVSLHDFPGFVIAVYQSRPQSRGWLKIRSADPRQPPSMVPNYLGEEVDRRTVIAGLRLVRRIAEPPSLRPYVQSELF